MLSPIPQMNGKLNSISEDVSRNPANNIQPCDIFLKRKIGHHKRRVESSVKYVIALIGTLALDI
jgi:hypothetical protein